MGLNNLLNLKCAIHLYRVTAIVTTSKITTMISPSFNCNTSLTYVEEIFLSCVSINFYSKSCSFSKRIPISSVVKFITPGD